jgi:PAS domain S-box-containing protein
MSGSSQSAATSPFAHHSGEMVARIRDYDWAATPLGPIESWPQSLKIAVDLMLASPGATSVMWGPERTQLYNDAYIAIASARHPHALGRPTMENWAEAYVDFLGPLLDRAFAGESVVVDHQSVALLSADGTTVEHVFTAAFSPIRDERGAVLGVFHPLVEVTEQVRAQAAMRETSRTLDAILNNTREAVFLMDHRQHCVFANAAAEELTGYKFTELQGRPLHDVIHHRKPDGSPYPLEECPIDRAFPERAQISGEELFVHRDGSLYPVAYTASPLLNEAGEPVGTVIEARNIAERRAREARLHELHQTLERRVAEALAERKVFADVVENSSAAVTALDMRFNVLAINRANVDAFETVFGKRPQVGDNLLEILSDMPEHQAQVREYWSRALAGEEYVLTEEFGELERRTYEVRFSVLRDTDGAQIGASSTAYDVTDRICAERRVAEAETARREADALYRAYFENSPEALFVVGVTEGGDFRVEQINPAHEAGVGFKLDDVRGKRIEEILPPDTAEQVLRSYRRVLESGEIYQSREVFTLHGEPQHWDTSLMPVRDGDGAVNKIIGSSRNVTRQVLAEEALRQAQKMEAMGSLTGGVAHDFNNLLTPIIGSLDMLRRRGGADEREQRLIAGALQSAEKAQMLVQRLLAFARRQPLRPAAVDISKLVRGMAAIVASTTGPQIQVVVDTSEDLPPAEADANQLEMALLNLAVNARDAMPGGGTLRISASVATPEDQRPPELRPGSYIRLSVSDTGVGMDEATLSRAIEPFFSTKGIGKGTGLGLSMVHGLAAQLGGALAIHSRPGLGTNVELWLPQSDRQPDTDDTQVGSAAMRRSARGTVLLVEDEDLVRASTSDMLSQLGYSVQEAHCGEEALRLVENGLEFDLLVTDHLMPGISGTELAREIRSRSPDVPVLVVSGYADVEALAPDLPRLSKPFRMDDLAAKLNELRSA